MSSVSGRVSDLVERRFQGNVNAASKAWGVPQPTLRRIVKGASERTTAADVLARIAKANATTIEWLLSGEGKAPALTDEQGVPKLGSRAEWFSETLPLIIDGAQEGETAGARDAAAAVVALMNVADEAFWFAALASPDDDKAAAMDDREVRSAADTIVRAWLALFHHLVAKHGADAVRERLVQNGPVTAVYGFSAHALTVALQNTQLPEGVLHAVLSEHGRALAQLEDRGKRALLPGVVSNDELRAPQQKGKRPAARRRKRS